MSIIANQVAMVGLKSRHVAVARPAILAVTAALSVLLPAPAYFPAIESAVILILRVWPGKNTLDTTILDASGGHAPAELAIITPAKRQPAMSKNVKTGQTPNFVLPELMFKILLIRLSVIARTLTISPDK